MATTEQVPATAADEVPVRRGPGWPRIALVGGAVAVLLVAVGVLVAQLRGDNSGPAGPDGHSAAYPGIPSGRTATPGWRLESSLGLEIEVPTDWATNDLGCGGTDAPTVARAQGAVTLCYRPEASTKQVAELLSTQYFPAGDDGVPAGYTRHPVTVDGVAAERADGRTENGRYESILTVASRRARLSVRTPDRAVLDQILASVQVVDVDHLGCATARPTKLRPPVPAGLATLVPGKVTEVDVCYYGQPDYPVNGVVTNGPLQGSGALTGADAQRLATALNAGMHGHNPDSRDCLAGQAPIEPDAVLLFRPATGAMVPVYLTSSGCWSRGFDNGSRVVKVTWPLVTLALQPLHTGFGMTGDIPGLPDSPPSKPEPSGVPAAPPSAGGPDAGTPTPTGPDAGTPTPTGPDSGRPAAPVLPSADPAPHA